MRLSARDETGTWAVIAGGGTGGHLYPGIAVAEALVGHGHDQATLRFVGARRGLEARIQALDGYQVTLLPGRGLVRAASLRGLVANAEAIGGALAAVAIAVWNFSRWRPAVVISLGGYASFACVVAACAWRVPIIVVSLDAVPGKVNRLAARIAAACAVVSPEVRLRRAVPTGVPVRAAIAAIERSTPEREEARKRLGIPPGAAVVAVSGGSLGSLRINRATVALAEKWADRSDVVIRHVVGTRDWAELDHTGALQGNVTYQPVMYEEDMASLYTAADIAVQRAGANTVAELAVAGLPSVLVPLPGSPGNHQGANARSMSRAGGAVVIEDEELDGNRLAQELDALLGDPDQLGRMGQAAGRLARPEAARDVARLVEEHARRNAVVQVPVNAVEGSAHGG
jgi:UDP-N-acetylglucosamine--N-acetylmuramyl-(pentapeptide) pyrophosphoryl-undecaprenol N-acetylglucosamine transferase